MVTPSKVADISNDNIPYTRTIENFLRETGAALSILRRRA